MITRAVIIFIIHYRMLTGLNLIIMTTIKVGDVATYLHRACSLRTSKISSIQIINCQNESEEVNELDLDEKDGRIGFEDGFCCHSGRLEITSSWLFKDSRSHFENGSFLYNGTTTGKG